MAEYVEREAAKRRLNLDYAYAAAKLLDELDAADKLAAYENAEPSWISVEERLPEWQDGKVLIHTRYGVSVAKRTVNGRWQGHNAIPKLITHWMPLPEPPEVEV